MSSSFDQEEQKPKTPSFDSQSVRDARIKSLKKLDITKAKPAEPKLRLRALGALHGEAKRQEDEEERKAQEAISSRQTDETIEEDDFQFSSASAAALASAATAGVIKPVDYQRHIYQPKKLIKQQQSQPDEGFFRGVFSLAKFLIKGWDFANGVTLSQVETGETVRDELVVKIEDDEALELLKSYQIHSDLEISSSQRSGESKEEVEEKTSKETEEKIEKLSFKEFVRRQKSLPSYGAFRLIISGNLFQKHGVAASTFHTINLVGLDFSECIFESVMGVSLNFIYSNFTNCKFTACTFAACNFQGVDFRDVEVRFCNFFESKLFAILNSRTTKIDNWTQNHIRPATEETFLLRCEIVEDVDISLNGGSYASRASAVSNIMNFRLVTGLKTETFDLLKRAKQVKTPYIKKHARLESVPAAADAASSADDSVPISVAGVEEFKPETPVVASLSAKASASLHSIEQRISSRVSSTQAGIHGQEVRVETYEPIEVFDVGDAGENDILVKFHDPYLFCELMTDFIEHRCAVLFRAITHDLIIREDEDDPDEVVKSPLGYSGEYVKTAAGFALKPTSHLHQFLAQYQDLARKDHLSLTQDEERLWNLIKEGVPTKEEQSLYASFNSYLKDFLVRNYELEGKNKVFISIENLCLEGSTIKKLNWNYAKIYSLIASNSMLRNIDLSYAELPFARFENVKIQTCSLKKAKLVFCNFTKAQISESMCEEASVRGSDFTDAIIRRIDISSIEADHNTMLQRLSFIGVNGKHFKIKGLQRQFSEEIIREDLGRPKSKFFFSRRSSLPISEEQVQRHKAQLENFIRIYRAVTVVSDSGAEESDFERRTRILQEQRANINRGSRLVSQGLFTVGTIATALLTGKILLPISVAYGASKFFERYARRRVQVSSAEIQDRFVGNLERIGARFSSLERGVVIRLDQIIPPQTRRPPQVLSRQEISHEVAERRRSGLSSLTLPTTQQRDLERRGTHFISLGFSLLAMLIAATASGWGTGIIAAGSVYTSVRAGIEGTLSISRRSQGTEETRSRIGQAMRYTGAVLGPIVSARFLGASATLVVSYILPPRIRAILGVAATATAIDQLNAAFNAARFLRDHPHAPEIAAVEHVAASGAEYRTRRSLFYGLIFTTIIWSVLYPIIPPVGYVLGKTSTLMATILVGGTWGVASAISYWKSDNLDRVFRPCFSTIFSCIRKVKIFILRNRRQLTQEEEVDALFSAQTRQGRATHRRTQEIIARSQQLGMGFSREREVLFDYAAKRWHELTALNTPDNPSALASRLAGGLGGARSYTGRGSSAHRRKPKLVSQSTLPTEHALSAGTFRQRDTIQASYSPSAASAAAGGSVIFASPRQISRSSSEGEKGVEQTAAPKMPIVAAQLIRQASLVGLHHAPSPSEKANNLIRKALRNRHEKNRIKQLAAIPEDEVKPEQPLQAFELRGGVSAARMPTSLSAAHVAVEIRDDKTSESSPVTRVLARSASASSSDLEAGR